jgi:hypothetical protein
MCFHETDTKKKQPYPIEGTSHPLPMKATRNYHTRDPQFSFAEFFSRTFTVYLDIFIIHLPLPD